MRTTVGEQVRRTEILGKPYSTLIQAMSQRVKNKSVIVTGSGGGIGEGIAKRLAEQGAQVIVNDIDPLRAEQVAAAIRSAGGLASFCRRCDPLRPSCCAGGCRRRAPWAA